MPSQFSEVLLVGSNREPFSAKVRIEATSGSRFFDALRRVRDANRDSYLGRTAEKILQWAFTIHGMTDDERRIARKADLLWPRLSLQELEDVAEAAGAEVQRIDDMTEEA